MLGIDLTTRAINTLEILGAELPHRPRALLSRRLRSIAENSVPIG